MLVAKPFLLGLFTCVSIFFSLTCAFSTCFLDCYLSLVAVLFFISSSSSSSSITHYVNLSLLAHLLGYSSSFHPPVSSLPASLIAFFTLYISPLVIFLFPSLTYLNPSLMLLFRFFFPSPTPSFTCCSYYLSKLLICLLSCLLFPSLFSSL